MPLAAKKLQLISQFTHINKLQITCIHKIVMGQYHFLKSIVDTAVTAVIFGYRRDGDLHHGCENQRTVCNFSILISASRGSPCDSMASCLTLPVSAVSSPVRVCTCTCTYLYL